MAQAPFVPPQKPEDQAVSVVSSAGPVTKCGTRGKKRKNWFRKKNSAAREYRDNLVQGLVVIGEADRRNKQKNH